jgi:hypothetical protein
MNKYIIELLKLNGRVIIPDFGCLSTDDEGKIIFNTYIKFDDGKLSSYISEQENIDQQEAKESIASWRNEVNSQLNSGQEYNLSGVGAFFKSGSDDLEFKINSSDSKTIVSEIQIVSTTEEKSPEIVHEKTEEVLKTDTENSAVESNDSKEDEIERPDSKHHKNIYIPPVSETKKHEETSAASLDAVLGKVNIETKEQENAPATHEKIESDQIEEKHDKNLELRHEPKEEDTRGEVNQVSSIAQEKQVKIEEPEHKVEDKSEERNISEEVTVKRKRGVFFYINIVLLLLIIGLSVFAYLYTDEISKWLGITTENVLPEVNEQEDLIYDEPIVEESNIDSSVDENFMDDVQEDVVPVDQPIIEQTPAIASGGNFHIIVGTFSIRENAEKLVQKIRDAGYDGKILRSTDIGHTVSFHSYNSKEEATNNIGKATEITGTSGYVLKQ